MRESMHRVGIGRLSHSMSKVFHLFAIRYILYNIKFENEI